MPIRSHFVLKGFALILVGILLPLLSKAQVISYPTAASAISRGLDSTTLTVRIDFPACTNPMVTLQLGAAPGSGNIEYIPGTITQTGGSPGVSIAESNITDLKNPVFAVTTTTSGQFIVFTIKRRADCGGASASYDKVFVSGGCSFSETDPNVNTYNLTSPALSLTTSAAISNANVGSSYNRTVTVTNGGNGCLNTLNFWVKYPAGSTQLNSLKIGATTLTAVVSTPDSSFFQISGTNLSADGKLCNGENVVLTENITVLKCNAVTSFGASWNGYGSASCASASASLGMTMSNNLPVLTASLPEPDSTKYNYCFNGDTKIQRVKITNTGAGTATNIELKLQNLIPGNFNGYTYFDTTTAWVVKDSANNVLGSVSGFYEMIYLSVPSPSCSMLPTPQTAKGKLSLNVILLPGQSIYVDVVTRTYNFSCNPSLCLDGIGAVGIQSQVNYKNQCGTGTYQENFKTLAQRNYSFFRNATETPTDVSGIAPNNTFNIGIDWSLFQTMNNPNGSGSSALVVPLTNTGLSPTASSITYAGQTLPINVVNDTMYITFPQNWQPALTSRMDIPMKADCSAGGGVKPFNMYALNKYSACSPAVKFGCQTSNITVHCPSPCSIGGATPVLFSLKRINFGTPDNDNNNLPDASGAIDLTKVNQYHSVNGDTLLGLWNIIMTPNTNASDPNFGGNFSHVYVDFNFGAPSASAGSLTPVLNANAQVWRSGSVIANLVATPSITGNIAHYEFPGATLPTGFWQVNDSIVISAKYTVIQTNSDIFNKSNALGFSVFKTDVNVYSTYVQKTTPQTAPSAGQTYTCDKYNDYSQMSRIWFSPFMPANQTIVGCNNLIQAQMRQYVRNQDERKVFPYEFRNFYILDTMKVRIPTGFAYRPNSGYIALPANAINNSNVYQLGDTLFFTNLKSFFTTYGGTLVPGDEFETRTVFFRLDPTCNASGSGTFTSFTASTGVGNGINTPSSNYVNTPLSTQTQANGYIYDAPQPVLSGGNAVVSTDGAATWNVVLQNQSSTATAANAYLYISPINSITNIVVKEGALTLTPDANGFYQLGDLATSANRTFTVTGKTQICTADSIRINQGFSCTGYPTSFVLQSCTKTKWLKIDNYESQIQLSVTKQPTAPSISLCTSDQVEFVINSAQAAFADNPRFVVTPSTGLNITTGEIEYPLSSGNWQVITPVIVAGQYTYNIENHAQLASLYGTKGLPGTIDYSGTDRRQAKLRLTYTTDCSFISGSKFAVQQKAERPCGSAISADNGYNNIVRTNPIDITGAGGAGVISFNLSNSPNPVGCGTFNMSGTVTPVLSPTTASDTIKVTLPAGLNYSGAFTGAPNATFVSTAVGAGNSTIVVIKLASGVAAGTAIPYGFNITPGAASGCGNFSILSEAERTFSPLTFNGTPCPNSSKAIAGSSSNDITISKPKVSITNVQHVSGEIMPGQTITYTVSMSNSSTTAVPANDLQLEFYCGNSTTPFSTQGFPVAIPASGSISTDVMVAVPASPVCNGGEVLRAVIRPATSVCLCDSVSFLLSQPLPIRLAQFSATSEHCMVNLKWDYTSDRNTVENFIIERSSNGTVWEKIQTLKSHEYSYTDVVPSSGKWLYRIVVRYTNSKIDYSQTVKINASKCLETSINVLPNPANDVIHVILQTSNNTTAATYSIVDISGRKILSGNLKANSNNTIQIDRLISGNYIIIVNDGANVHHQKLTKL